MMSRSAARRQSTLELAALMLLTTVTRIVCAAPGYRRRINHTRPAEGVPTLVEPDGIHGPVHKDGAVRHKDVVCHPKSTGTLITCGTCCQLTGRASIENAQSQL